MMYFTLTFFFILNSSSNLQNYQGPGAKFTKSFLPPDGCPLFFFLLLSNRAHFFFVFLLRDLQPVDEVAYEAAAKCTGHQASKHLMASVISLRPSVSTPTTGAVPQAEASSQATSTSGTSTESKPKKKICCACPDTKRLRDECIVEHGEDACTKWIEAHRMCLRAEGFNV